MKTHGIILISYISSIFWNCYCISDSSIIKTERACPPLDDTALRIHHHNSDVTIECRKKINWTNQLPCLQIGSINLITIDSCPFPHSVSNVFQRLGISYVQKLNIVKNKKYESGTFPKNSFRGVYNLKVLTMKHNNLKYISGESFEGFDDLIELNISDNSLEVTNDTFKYLSQLESLYLANNGLRDLPYGAFHNLSELRNLDLESNNLCSIDSPLLNNLKKLEILDLSNNNLENLPINLFSQLVSLELLYLQGNKIKRISNNTFQGLASLKELNLSFNEIELLPDFLFSSLHNLTNLVLSNNLLTSISENSFFDIRNLKILNLGNNKIKNVHKKSLYSLINLKELTLAYNYIYIPLFTLINNNEHIERIYLSHNNITELNSHFVFYNNLKELDLSYNQLNYTSVHQLAYFTTITINLSYNRIKIIDFSNLEYYSNYSHEKILELDGNPLHCDCSVFDFIKYVKNSTLSHIKVKADSLYCSSPKTYANIAVKEVQPDLLTDILPEKKLTENCSAKSRCSDGALIVDCSNSNLTSASDLVIPKGNFDHTEVYIQNNLLTSVPERDIRYENVTVLDLSNNRIEEITWLPPKLQVLNLVNNNITTLKRETLDRLKSSSITTLKLGVNPWRCNCSAINITSFFITNSIKMQIDIENIRCNGTGLLMVSMKEEIMCPNPQMLIMSICIGVLIPIIMIAVVVAVCFRYQTEVKVFLYVHCGWVFPESDEDKIYDAFISYSHKDEQFVLKELLPVMEQGPTPYKVCIHIRDWTAGEFISNQIATSVAESRRTIVILSPSFLESEWGKMEFRTAHTQAIKEGTARVILILYGNVNLNADLDEELQAYIRTYTYLKWGDPWFWDQLIEALPHLNRKDESTKNKCFPFVKKRYKTDDKNLDLVNIHPSVVNPISTPPTFSPSFFNEV